MPQLVLFIVILLCSMAGNSQLNAREKLAKGTIRDIVTGETIDMATILIYPGFEHATTDELGRFYILAKKIDSLVVTALGYGRKVISNVNFHGRENTIALTRRIMELRGVTVALGPGDQFKPIGKLDIRIRGVNNSQEVLRLVPGLFIGQHAGGGKAEQIFLRGFDIDHGTDVNLTVDGVPVNMVSHAHGQGYADLHFLIPELIDKVSFKKGPYHAEKGNFTTAGFVDFRTKNVLETNMIKLETGQFNTHRLLGMMNLVDGKKSESKPSAFIATEYMYTNGYFDHPQNFKRLNVFGKYRQQISKLNSVSVSASTFASNWNASGQIPERALQSGFIGYFGAIDPNEGGNTRRNNVNVELSSRLRNGGLIRNQVYYSRYDFELYSNFTFFLNNNLDGDQIRQKERRNLLGYNSSYSYTGFVGEKKLATAVGVTLRYDKTNNTELSRTKDRDIVTSPIQLGDISEFNTGAWANNTIQWSRSLSMTAGLRWDRFDVQYSDKLGNAVRGNAKAGILSPKLNFYYQLNNKTQFYLTTGKGFHSNDTRVVVQTGGKEILPAAYGLDLGMIWKPASDLFIQTAIWYLKLGQEFVYVGDEGIVEPGGRSRRVGVDLSLRWQAVKSIYLDFDANYSNARAMDATKGAAYLPLAPVFTSIGGITLKTDFGINASLRYRYMGDRPANENYSRVAKGYMVTDAVLSYTTKEFEIGMSVQNLLDVRWKETQFDTESKLQNESAPVSEIHFTPGTPFFLKGHVSFYF
ncbi:MAG: TonB-dependent receptor [Chitinophagaceae bacterium]|nr:TonB-dependent receptor [Chitinophagaceae bacterium]